MKIKPLSLICLCLATSAFADLKKLDGTWKPTSGEMGKSQLPKAFLDKMILILKNGEYDYDEGHGHDIGVFKEMGKGLPLGLDIVGTKGPNKGRTFRTIYKYDGKSLTICYGMGTQRPTTFDAKEKGVILLVTYQRTTTKS